MFADERDMFVCEYDWAQVRRTGRIRDDFHLWDLEITLGLYFLWSTSPQSLLA